MTARKLASRAPRIRAVVVKDEDVDMGKRAQQIDEEARRQSAKQEGLKDTRPPTKAESYLWLLDQARDLINGAEAGIDLTKYCHAVEEAWAALAAVRRQLKGPSMIAQQREFQRLRKRAQRMLGVCPRKEATNA